MLPKNEFFEKLNASKAREAAARAKLPAVLEKKIDEHLARLELKIQINYQIHIDDGIGNGLSVSVNSPDIVAVLQQYKYLSIKSVEFAREGKVWAVTVEPICTP